MDRNVWIAAALAALLVGFGVAVGTGFSGPGADAPRTGAAPDLLETPRREPAHPAAGPALDTDLGPQILQRLGRLEAAVEELRQQQSKLAQGMEPAAEVIAFFKGRIPARSNAGTDANQTAAIATLRNVVSAQAQLQATGAHRHGRGRHGRVRGLPRDVRRRRGPHGQAADSTRALERAFRRLNENGEADRAAATSTASTCRARGEGIGEPQAGFTRATRRGRRPGGDDLVLLRVAGRCEGGRGPRVLHEPGWRRVEHGGPALRRSRRRPAARTPRSPPARRITGAVALGTSGPGRQRLEAGELGSRSRTGPRSPH